MPFSFHKKKQGLIVRWCFFAVLVALAVFASYRCMVGFPYSTTETRPEFWDFFYKTILVEFTIPLIELAVVVTPKWVVAISLGFLLVFCATYLTFMNVRVSEFLIDTETEMRKVSWPSKDEVADSSLVVIIVIIAMGVYLFVLDIGLNKFIQWLIF